MYLKTFKELKTLLPPQSFTYVFIKSENINETFLKKPSFKTSLLFSSLSIPPRCLGKENRVNGTSYPNPRLCPLLKDPAQRMLCRSKQVPQNGLQCPLFSGAEDLAQHSTGSSYKLPNRVCHASGCSMVPERIPFFFLTYTP